MAWARRVKVDAGMRAVGGCEEWNSPRVREVMGMFGIAAGNAKLETRNAKRLKALSPGEVEIKFAGGKVVLIGGPSGAGKSTLLRGIEAVLRNDERGTMNGEMGGAMRVVRLTEIPLEGDRAVIDCFPGNLSEAMASLSRAGLAEPRLWLRAPAELSEGEQFRYRLARFIAGPWDVLLADEFCGTLDSATARVVSWNLAKFVRESAGGPRPRALIVATARGDLLEDLRPEVWIYLSPGQEPRVQITKFE